MSVDFIARDTGYAEDGPNIAQLPGGESLEVYFSALMKAYFWCLGTSMLDYNLAMLQDVPSLLWSCYKSLRTVEAPLICPVKATEVHSGCHDPNTHGHFHETLIVSSSNTIVFKSDY